MLRSDCGKVDERPSRRHYEVLHDWSSKSTSDKKKGSGRVYLDVVSISPAASGSHSAFGSFSTSIPPKPRDIGIWTPLREIHMPYNNAAIPPSEEITGSASLPFKHQLQPQADVFNVASAVTRIDNLEFLADVIPKTTTYREYKEKKAKTARSNAPLSSDQTTLDNPRSLPSRPADVINPRGAQGTADSLPPDDTADGYAAESAETRVPRTNGAVVFEHYEPKSNSHPYESDDVEMG
ncbi:MAG: hypothetical protein Q9181_001567 [Wetmoreana brouardii]